MKKQETRKSVDFTHYKIQDSSCYSLHDTAPHGYTGATPLHLTCPYAYSYCSVYMTTIHRDERHSLVVTRVVRFLTILFGLPFLDAKHH